VVVQQVEPQAVDAMHAAFGGSRLIVKQQHGRPMFRFTVTGQRAAACLSAIRPHLLIKAAQADNALAVASLNPPRALRP
jgi:hypothetical protein